MLTPLFIRQRLIAGIFVCLIFVDSALVAPLFVASHPAFADGPTLKRLFPAGAQRGASVEVAALGDAPKWPVKVWTDDPGIQWEALTDKAKFKVSVADSVTLGQHSVRFYDEDNSTEAFRFVVGLVAELNEQEPNDAPDKAHVVTEFPKLINGVLDKRAEVDTFAVDLKQGQHLIAAIDAQQSLRSPLDATLQIVSGRGFVLAQNLDTVGLDPRIHFVAPRDGRFYVRVFAFPETPDSTISYAGGENFVYRLTLAHSAFVFATRPLAVSSAAETQLELIGVALPSPRATVNVPANVKETAWRLTIDGGANFFALPILKCPVLVEQTQAAAGEVQSLPVPGSVTGRLDEARQVDRYHFTAKKETKLNIELHSRKFGLPTDGVIKILDASGQQLAREDDARSDVDAKALWQPPADGQYTLEVSDAFGAGGPEWLYRVDIQVAERDAVATVKADHFQGKLNEPIDITVSIDRRNGFDQPLRINVTGLPESVQCPAVVSEKEGASAKEVTLKLTATAPFSGAVQIVASLEADSTFQRVATAGSDGLVNQMWLTIK